MCDGHESARIVRFHVRSVGAIRKRSPDIDHHIMEVGKDHRRMPGDQVVAMLADYYRRIQIEPAQSKKWQSALEVVLM
jgi:hypothetical protein